MNALEELLSTRYVIKALDKEKYFEIKDSISLLQKMRELKLAGYQEKILRHYIADLQTMT